MRMIVMGTGPIGGIIGGRLMRAGQDITFVDVDREHIAAIREKGLQVDVPDGPFNDPGLSPLLPTNDGATRDFIESINQKLAA